MRDYLEPMLGTNGALIAQFAITLAVVAVIILIVFWLIRVFTGGRAASAAIRGRQPRLSVLDALPVDQRRRLVLVRRDNVEHLILIGGPTDLVVEAAIHRPSAAQRRAEAAARAGQPAPRYPQPVPLGERQPYDEPPREEAQPVAWSEPARAEPAYDAPEAEPVREQPARAEPVRESLRAEPSRREPMRPEPVAEEPAAAPPAPEPEPAAEIEPPRPAPRASRPISSFLSRNRTETPPEPPRQLSRATPVAPRPVEPVAEEEPPVQEAPAAEPVAPEPPPRPEPPRVAAPQRPAPRPAMPPAPPVAPPTLGDEPYGAPTSDADRPLRFEPIFDIDPTDATDPGRPVRQSREPSVAAPLVPPVAPQRPMEQPVSFEDAGPDEDTLKDDPRNRAAVGDLEKEMARLLGEISGTRRS